MGTYRVHVVIENKPGMRDPEGETILNDLVVKAGAAGVSEIRAAKMLKFTVDGDGEGDAVEKVRGICDELRIYNPLVSRVTVTVPG